MGLENKTDLTFISPRGGKLVVKREGDITEEYSQFSGYIEKVTLKDDEYQGQKFKKAMVFMSGGNCLSFRINSWFGKGFFDRIGQVNMGEQCIIKAQGSKNNDKITFCNIDDHRGQWIKGSDATPKPNDPQYDSVVESIVNGLNFTETPDNKQSDDPGPSEEPFINSEEDDLPF